MKIDKYTKPKENGTSQPVKPKKGDVLGIRRNMSLIGSLYEHYGIYTDKGTVIHYTTRAPVFNLKLEVMETSFKEFIQSDTGFFVLNFDNLNNPVKSDPNPAYELKNIAPSDYMKFLSALWEIRKMLQKSQMKIFSPEETVKRARSRLGEKSYNLLFNNCEHLAIWCKTGLSKSYQIEKLLKVLIPEEGFV